MSTATPPPAAEPEPAPAPDLKILWVRVALFLAIIGVLGSLHLSINMGLQACPLCYYQRAFMMAAAGILLFAMFLPGVPSAAVSVLALTPASAGLCIAAAHVQLEWAGVLECPKGISGMLVVPQESLIVFVLLVGSLIGDLLHRKTYFMQGAGAILLGYVFYSTCWNSVQTKYLPTPPYEKTHPNEPDPDSCRKPFVKKDGA